MGRVTRLPLGRLEISSKTAWIVLIVCYLIAFVARM